jgi:hypothetical protein
VNYAQHDQSHATAANRSRTITGQASRRAHSPARESGAATPGLAPYTSPTVGPAPAALMDYR